MNAADNKGATVAVDSLINYEAVKVGLFSCQKGRHLSNSLNSTSITKGLKSGVTMLH